VLIAQDHSPEDDLAFIEYVSHYLRDSRYIKIQGKPLLIVYRPGTLPSAKKTAKRWRSWCRENNLGEIYLAYTQSFESVKPKKFGFDGAIEFPPNNTVPPIITDLVKTENSSFSGVAYDWNTLVERSQKYQKPDYPLFRGVCPSWDNTARRMSKATVFLGSTPKKYGTWLENAALDTISRFSDPSERLVFVNAWNEWAEGAYLEPDSKYGYGYLQATRDALESVNTKLESRRVVLVAHDAHPMGAQYLTLHMAKMLVEDFGFQLDIVVLGDGPLLKDYGQYATLHILHGKDPRGEHAKALAAELFAEGFRSAIANTAVSGLFTQVLKEQGFHVISLIHELPGIIKHYNLQLHVKSIAEYADWVVFPAKMILEGFELFSPVSLQRTVIRPQGLFRKNSLRSAEQVKRARKDLRSQFGLPATAQIILCIGYADRRKGIDLFVDIGLKVMRQMPNSCFLWVGHFDPALEPDIKSIVDHSGFSNRFVFPGLDFQSDLYYAGSDVFALTSREDPFPSVVLEALDANLPIVAFDGVGGFTDLLSRGGGRLIHPFDTDEFANALIDLLSQPEKAHALGISGGRIVEREFSFRRYLFDLLKLAKAPIKCVSVIVPNFNYARYLAERLKTIVDQNYPIYEIIILDDASNDDSVQLLNKIISKLSVDCRLVVNESNSGKPFVQWLKGVELAQGDYIWIAEADDISEPGFLDEVLQPFKDPSVVMSYCQSKQIDSKGIVLCNDYLDYVNEVSTKKWKKYYVTNGLDEIRTCLAVKNTIPNVSAVVFEKKTMLNVLKERIDEIKTFQVAGDWMTYIYILEHGKIAYSPKSLNLHRRHKNSVTLGNFEIRQLEEILRVQQTARKNFHPNEDVLIKTHAYSERLYQEFNLSTPNAPILTDHPKLVAYIEN
jgi:glycosyltransferase involved in cell wall biosynthesis